MDSQSDANEDQLNNARIQDSPYRMTPSNKKLKLKKTIDLSVLQNMTKSIEIYSKKMKKKKKINFIDFESESSTKKFQKASFDLNQSVQSSSIKQFSTPSRQLKERKQIPAKTISAVKLKKAKHDKHYNQLCPICLGQLQQPHAKLGCTHKFCFTCIKYWSESSSKCPCCRKQFNQIYQGDLIIKIQTKKLVVEDDDDYIQPCYVCNRNEDIHLLLLCDLCQNFCCHIYCDPSLNNRFPAGDWFCKFCQNESNEDNTDHNEQNVQKEQIVENIEENQQSTINHANSQKSSQKLSFQESIKILNNIASRTRSKVSNNNNNKSQDIVRRLRRLRDRD